MSDKMFIVYSLDIYQLFTLSPNCKTYYYFLFFKSLKIKLFSN